MSWRRPLVATCVALAIAGGTLAQAAPSDSATAAGAPTTSDVEFAKPALRIGELSERLFDWAARSDWMSARRALRSLHDQSRLLDGPFEQRFLAAGGDIDALVRARNALAGALADADIASRAQESRSLAKLASGMTVIAGELAEPFAEAPGAPIELRVYAAMFQSRRMLAALTWSDERGYEAAHSTFRRLWLAIRTTPGLDPDKVMALDRALASAALSRSDQTARDLQLAAQNVIGGLGLPMRSLP
jgi:hypothetical protein